MASIHKLKHNLQASAQWALTFRQEIKQMLEEITLKNQQVYKTYDQNNKAKEQLNRLQAEHKSIIQDKQKMAYKIQKIQIELQKSHSRVKVYEESVKKKMDWNSELSSKIQALEMDIQKQKNSLAEQSFYNSFDSFKEELSLNSSIYSERSDFKEKSIKSAFLATKTHVNDNLLRVQRLSKEYIQHLAKIRTKDGQIERLQKRELQMRQKLKNPKQQQGLNDQNKQNIKYNQEQGCSFDSFHQTNKETRLQLAKIRQLQQKNKDLNKQIGDRYDWINQFAANMEQVVQCQKVGEDVRKQMVNMEREVKKQKLSNDKISHYFIKPTNQKGS